MSFAGQSQRNDTNDTISEYNRILEHYISLLQLLNDEQSRIANIQTHIHRKVSEVLSIMRWAPNFRRVNDGLFSSLQSGNRNTNRNYTPSQEQQRFFTPGQNMRNRSQPQTQQRAQPQSQQQQFQSNNGNRRNANRRSNNTLNQRNTMNNITSPFGMRNPRILNRDTSLNNLPGAIQELLNVFGNPAGENGSQVNFTIPPQNNNDGNIRNLLFEVGTFPLQSRFENVPVFPSPEQIETATESVHFQDISDPINTNCPITMEPFSQNQIVTRIRHCGHIFNTTHLNSWFRNNVQCPVCRFDIRDYRQNDISNSSSLPLPPGLFPSTTPNTASNATHNTSSNMNSYIPLSTSMFSIDPNQMLNRQSSSFNNNNNGLYNGNNSNSNSSNAIADRLLTATLERMITDTVLNEPTENTSMNTSTFMDISGMNMDTTENDSDTMSQD
jgi:hypothetical protein